MVNYADCKIYKLVLKGGDELNDMYIGSTCRPLCKRMSDHRSNARVGKTSKVYQWMRDVGIENIEIVLVANCPCENYEQQLQHERRYVDEMQPSQNMLSPYISREECLAEKRDYNKEYYGQNKEAIAEKGREYRERNKEAIFERKREYRERNKEDISEKRRDYYKRNKEAISEREREYRERSKETISERGRDYYNRNKEAIKTRALQKYHEKKLLQRVEQSSQLDTNVN